jgi:hypothetical protein
MAGWRLTVNGGVKAMRLPFDASWSEVLGHDISRFVCNVILINELDSRG